MVHEDPRDDTVWELTLEGKGGEGRGGEGRRKGEGGGRGSEDLK